jgi:hypothetical protein
VSLTLKDIAKGLMKGELPVMAEGELAEERMKMCRVCPHFKSIAHQCDLCGCFLDLKTKLLAASCPIDKW